MKAWSSTFSQQQRLLTLQWEAIASGLPFYLKQPCGWKRRLTDSLKTKRKVICGLRWASSSHYAQAQTGFRACNLLNYIPKYMKFASLFLSLNSVVLKTESTEQQHAVREGQDVVSSLSVTQVQLPAPSNRACLIIGWNQLTVNFKLVVQGCMHSID